jgi:predicted MFS family arabinose efflux permease
VTVWPSYWGFALTLVLSMLGKFTFDPAMQAYLGDRVPYERRGTVLAITEFGWSGAFFLGMPLVGFVISRFGWLAPFPMLALLGGLSFLILMRMLPADPPPSQEGAGMLVNFRTVFRHGPAVAGLLLVVSTTVANELVNLMFGVWLEDSFALKLTALGAASAVIGLAEVFGEGLVGLASDWLGKRRAIAFGLLGNFLAALALPRLGGSVPGALLGLFLFYLSFEFTFVTIIPLMSEVLPPARATLMAMGMASASLGRALAAWATPPLYAFSFELTTGASAVITLLGLLALRFVVVPEGEG